MNKKNNLINLLYNHYYIFKTNIYENIKTKYNNNLLELIKAIIIYIYYHCGFGAPQSIQTLFPSFFCKSINN